MKQLIFVIVILVFAGHAGAFPTEDLTGTVEQRYDRTIIVNGAKFSPGKSFHLLPDWVKPGERVQLLYICNESAECFYIDVVREGEEFPSMPKIESGAMTADDVFPKR